MRCILAASVSCLLAVLACGPTQQGESPGDTTALGGDTCSTAGTDVCALHGRVLTLDSHAGFTDPLRSCGPTERQVDIPKMRWGGVDAVFFSVYAGQGERTGAAYAHVRHQALKTFRSIHDLTDRCSEELGLARTPEEVEDIVDGGRRAVVIGMENGYLLGGDLTALERYAELGGAYLGLTHDGHNALADAAVPREELGDPPAEHDGVSPFGERVIAELNRLGVMVDVSHLSRKAAREAIRLSRAPVIASHSSMDAIKPHPRNLDDETARAMAAGGGVIQITPVHEFLKVDPPGAMEAFHALLDEFGLGTDAEAKELRPARRAAFEDRLAELDRRWARASVVHLVDHIDYAVGLVGGDHVGIGSDFGGGGGVTGWMDASQTASVTAELVRRGYTEEEIRKIWGGNLLRVWREVRRLAENQP